ncbi:Probable glucan 1,3-beta-glucosidase A [Seminavis robusta]|uniref:glucan 1,3-beta-glucosidase n=1 Tax=Seminavis robusta TaxID=568900 RepID=A0A9N8H4U1_9STRA|nr:Probable glucan 1,3-beta-glucosidase A [Seminavis robusta]|eukprot:Sro94_g048880.1 Probable glucan 1,3-beta-glucosidase A (578) ;mRNA; f:26774-29011
MAATTHTQDPMHLEPIFVNPRSPHRWVRGVNLGGWLLLERYISPFQFSITSCHLEGDFCWYPGQASAPPEDSPEYQLCDLYACQPHLIENVDNIVDYPIDEYTLSSSFSSKETGAQWLNFHFEHFLKREDLVAIKEAGATHVRVPVPHFMLEEPRDDEPWIAGDRWKYFVRAAKWCREIGLEMWPDLHTVPGSQNGFDNGGQYLNIPTCNGWAYSQQNILRTVEAVKNMAHAIKRYGLDDVVTGVGLLNEPFTGCDQGIVRHYYQLGLEAVRGILGKNTAVYISDIFEANKFNDGFWQGSSEYENTFLDSHYYHVFGERSRSLSPRGHIAYVCQKNYREATSCCYENPPANTKVSTGMKRMFGEWSVSYDTLVVLKLYNVTAGIAKTGIAPYFDRQIPPARQDFLRNFAKAQMIAYEAAEVGTSAGWFYWTFKMEGGVFAEWDFLRGIREGWLPKVPPVNVSSEEFFDTTCHNLIFRTDDSMKIVKEYPDPDNLPENTWFGDEIDDDVVVSHGDSLLKGWKGSSSKNGAGLSFDSAHGIRNNIFLCAAIMFFGYAVWRVCFKGRRQRKGYTELEQTN